MENKVENKNVYVIGAKGRLGVELVKYGIAKPLDCDITDHVSVHNAINNLATKPDVIVHTAAKTNVDECETSLHNAMNVNGIVGAMNIREAFDGRLIYLSTDYVFDGKSGPYSEDDEPNPINLYGQGKLSAEKALLEDKNDDTLIVRTTILYSHFRTKPDFVQKILQKLSMGAEIYLPELYGTPTYVYHLCVALANVIYSHENLRGVLHIAGKDCINRIEFAHMIAKTFGYTNPKIHSNGGMIPTESYSNVIASRPMYAGLRTSVAQALGVPIFSVQQGLDAYKRSVSPYVN